MSFFGCGNNSSSGLLDSEDVQEVDTIVSNTQEEQDDKENVETGPSFRSYYGEYGEFFEEWLQNGLITCRRITFSDGVIYESNFEYVDGIIVKEVSTSPDSVDVMEYVNGVKVKETQTFVDYVNVIEYADDLVVKETITNADGSVIVTSHTYKFQEGTIIQKISNSSDGRYCETDYVNGMATEERNYSGDGAINITRWKNGVITFSSFEFEDGTYEKCYYNETGLKIYEEGYVAAWGESHTTTYTVGSNGLYTYSIRVTNDGTVEEVYYDEEGNPIK